MKKRQFFCYEFCTTQCLLQHYRSTFTKEFCCSRWCFNLKRLQNSFMCTLENSIKHTRRTLRLITNAQSTRDFWIEAMNSYEYIQKIADQSQSSLFDSAGQSDMRFWSHTEQNAMVLLNITIKLRLPLCQNKSTRGLALVFNCGQNQCWSACDGNLLGYCYGGHLES